MGNTSDYTFVDGSEFQLNQLFGYQDAEEGRSRGLRIRDALRRQHAWDDTSRPTWANPWNLGDHIGVVGYQADPTQTQFYGRINPLIWNTYIGAGTPLAIDYRNSASPGTYQTDAQGPTMPALYLSGDFTLHLYFLVLTNINSQPAWNIQWGGTQTALIRPEFYHEDGNVYTYPADDITIATGANIGDSYGMFYWFCHWVGNITSFPPGVATVAFSCNGDWGATGPASVGMYCLTNGQIRYLMPMLTTAGSLLINTIQLGSGMRTIVSAPTLYLGQGPDCFNKFVAYAL